MRGVKRSKREAKQSFHLAPRFTELNRSITSLLLRELHTNKFTFFLNLCIHVTLPAYRSSLFLKWSPNFNKHFLPALTMYSILGL